MELLKCLIVLYEQFINRKQKSGGTHAYFEKDRLVSQSVNAKLVKGHNCSKGRGSPQKTLILKCFYLSYVTSKSPKISKRTRCATTERKIHRRAENCY